MTLYPPGLPVPAPGGRVPAMANTKCSTDGCDQQAEYKATTKGGAELPICEAEIDRVLDMDPDGKLFTLTTLDGGEI